MMLQLRIAELVALVSATTSLDDVCGSLISNVSLQSSTLHWT